MYGPYFGGEIQLIVARKLRLRGSLIRGFLKKKLLDMNQKNGEKSEELLGHFA